ncbi:hypothetical protein [Undibacterium griseum]|jgi:hypothetical protein|uniref:Uncharacterized protein n=1 Tax=Undibacterium griseum TaxID=2762295 RepID=A0ABR6YP07_9BURK|nr:hypothetical protein [Undibacterium griseum]MBC3885638.1 hypothetical protein [Undibacterium griseum]
MKFQTELKVLGMKSSKGKMDNGMEFDSTKVYVETPLDDSKGNAKGCSVAEYNLGLAEEFNKYKHLPFPFMATATVEVVVSGKNQKMQLSELKPVDMVKQPKAA